MSRIYQMRVGQLVDLHTTGAAPRMNANSTGTITGIPLTDWTGGITLAPDIYENIHFPDQGTYYTITAGSGLTLRNCKFDGSILVFECDNILMEFCETTAISFSSCHTVTMRRVHLSGSTNDFIDIFGDDTNRADNRCLDVLIEECYIHNPIQLDPLDHNDAIQIRGAHNLTIRRCNVDMGPFMPSHDAAILLENANDGNSNVIIADNYLNGGGNIVRLQSYTGFFEFTGNVFGPDFGFSEFAQYAPLPSTQTGNLDHNLNPLILVVNN